MNTCKRCGHTWRPREPGVRPKTCPKCKSYVWDQDRKR